jgi:hypothetical protein
VSPIGGNGVPSVMVLPVTEALRRRNSSGSIRSSWQSITIACSMAKAAWMPTPCTKARPGFDRGPLVGALVLGISRARVSRLNVEGVLPRAGKELFDLPACVQAYLSTRWR